MAKLFLVRHGKSAWNKLGLWTGWTDVDLDEDGVAEAYKAGEKLKDEDIHKVYTSELKRTHQTFEAIKKGSGKHDHLDHTPHRALNERHYGIHTGKNKWQIKEEVGDEEFTKIRRGWNTPILEGETLKDVHARVVPYYEENIKKDLEKGENVLVVAHGNTLRALVKHLENLDEVEVCEVEIETGEVHCYHMDEGATMLHKEIKGASSKDI
jgi:2,3-bisphosphoglycerate-dependent phosphoglycerate mutase